ncbi:MAG: hypothetical protein COB66_05145 [Coxiella sp. (in: Bacteria)]|nr:MAG: hypothetical protein COB66_05145 [Coxiella sp. (in: g-proteobacteria)]
MMKTHYDVIIVGGGPVGVALGIELGLHGVNTLILEKYADPLLSPRAQSLTARSMEFFMRWGINKTLRQRQLLPNDFKRQGVWCSALNGKTYATASSFDDHDPTISPEQPIRIPLWITEQVLRERLTDFDCVTFLKNHDVTAMTSSESGCELTVLNRDTQHTETYTTPYIAACDGANSIIRTQAQIPFEQLAPAKHVLNLLFKAPELMSKITVEEGFLHYMLNHEQAGAMGIVDPEQHIWYAQIIFPDASTTLDDVDIATTLTKLSGVAFEHEILNAHFWEMKIQLAEHFSVNNRVFLVGDSAHAFAPTGGLGLNTGLGDVVNLGWKLASVINNDNDPTLLTTYETERRPIALRNLKAAQKNADDAVNVRKQHDPETKPEQFANALSRLAKQHANSLGLTMGYNYADAPTDNATYTPRTDVGFVIPHKDVAPDESIYQVCSPSHWTLIVSGDNDPDNLSDLHAKFMPTEASLDIIRLPDGTYDKPLIFVRPDWHIVYAGNGL